MKLSSISLTTLWYEEAKEGESASGATKESGDEVYDEVN